MKALQSTGQKISCAFHKAEDYNKTGTIYPWLIIWNKSLSGIADTSLCNEFGKEAHPKNLHVMTFSYLTYETRHEQLPVFNHDGLVSASFNDKLQHKFINEWLYE